MYPRLIRLSPVQYLHTNFNKLVKQQNHAKEFIFSVALFGCSKDDEPKNETGNGEINPPEWLIGQWTMDEEYNAVFLDVTKTGIYEGVLGSVDFARTNIVERYVGMGLSVKESVKNSSEYNIQFIYPLLGQVQGEYNFKKTGNNTMTYRMMLGAEWDLTRITKQ
ncbi:hypothetical protein Barb6_02796 [Bacteroidales bacterium Barb6]|nr:hypothetical protein Barb6_02796 [Bacteroidales bacterium Barb6]